MSTPMGNDNDDDDRVLINSEEFDVELNEIFKNAPSSQVISSQITNKNNPIVEKRSSSNSSRNNRRTTNLYGNLNLSKSTIPSSSRISRKTHSSMTRTYDDPSRLARLKEGQVDYLDPYQKSQSLIENTIFVGNVPKLVIDKVSYGLFDVCVCMYMGGGGVLSL